jgi:hypothetical protein
MSEFEQVVFDDVADVAAENDSSSSSLSQASQEQHNAPRPAQGSRYTPPQAATSSANTNNPAVQYGQDEALARQLAAQDQQQYTREQYTQQQYTLQQQLAQQQQQQARLNGGDGESGA